MTQVLIVHWPVGFDGIAVDVFPSREDAATRFVAESAGDRYSFVIERDDDLLGLALTVPADELEPARTLTGAGLARIYNAFADEKVEGRFTNRTAGAKRTARMLLAKFANGMQPAEPVPEVEIEDDVRRFARVVIAGDIAKLYGLEPKLGESQEELASRVERHIMHAPEPVPSAADLETSPTGIVYDPKTLLVTQSKPKRGFSFSAVGIPVGAVLASTFDQDITCIVVGDGGRVMFDGEESSLSKAALTVAHRKGYTWPTIQGPRYWIYEGKKLCDA